MIKNTSYYQIMLSHSTNYSTPLQSYEIMYCRFRLLWPKNWWPEDVQDGFSTPKKSCMRSSTSVTPNSADSSSVPVSISVEVNSDSATLHDNGHTIIPLDVTDVIPVASPPSASMSISTSTSMSMTMGMSILRSVSEPSTPFSIPSVTLPLSLLADSNNKDNEKDNEREKEKEKDKDKDRLHIAQSAAAAVLASFSTTKEWIKEEVRTFNKLPPNSFKSNNTYEQMQVHDEEGEGEGEGEIGGESNEGVNDSIESKSNKKTSPIDISAGVNSGITSSVGGGTSAGTSVGVGCSSSENGTPAGLRVRTATARHRDSDRSAALVTERLSPLLTPFPPPLRFSPHPCTPLPLPLTLPLPPSSLIASKVETDLKFTPSKLLQSQSQPSLPAAVLVPGPVSESLITTALVSTSVITTAVISVSVPIATTTSVLSSVATTSSSTSTSTTTITALASTSSTIPALDPALTPIPVPATLPAPVPVTIIAPVLATTSIIQPSEIDILTMKACEEMNLMTSQMLRDKETIEKEESENKCMKWLGKLSGATELLQNKIAAIKSNMISSDATLFNNHQSPPFFRKSVTESSIRSRSHSDAAGNNKLSAAMNGFHGILHRRHSYNARRTYFILCTYIFNCYKKHSLHRMG